MEKYREPRSTPSTTIEFTKFDVQTSTVLLQKVYRENRRISHSFKQAYSQQSSTVYRMRSVHNSRVRCETGFEGTILMDAKTT